MRRLLLGILALLALAGCAPATGGSTAAPLQFRAEVVHVALEGGFWGLVAADGRRYDPGRLPPEFRQAGLKVEVAAKPVTRVSFRMWGTPIELVRIERADPR